MIVSSKPDNLYPNSCAGPGGSRPRGFMPGSHAATAEFFALYYGNYYADYYSDYYADFYTTHWVVCPSVCLSVC